MKKSIFGLILIMNLLCPSAFAQQGLKDVLGKHFLMGVALNQRTVNGQDKASVKIVKKHFNSAVAENCMKVESLQPQEGLFNFSEADKFIDFCQKNHLTIIGHCLVWHAQTPAWFFTDSEGKPASRELLAERIKNHISTVVKHFKGKVHGWDVCNEIVEWDGQMRRSPLYNIMGEDFVELAFRTAHEADPDAELYLNDYGMWSPGKRATYVYLIHNLQAKGLRIDAIGMQSHHGMGNDAPNMEEYEKSLEAYAQTGLKVMITELDLDVLPSPYHFRGAEISQNFEGNDALNPYTKGIPEEMQQKIHDRWMDFFKLYHKHRDQISRITFWGVNDGVSWLNGFPVKGRTNYPLFFDRNYQEKPIIKDVIELFK